MKTYVELTVNSEIMRGYHYQTNSDKLVVMFHGFTGNKTESGYMFRKLSDRLVKENIDSIRFDYLGSGESDGLFSEMTLDHLITQAKTVLEYSNSHNYKEIIILGFSMGGALALNLLQGANKAILISPAISFFAKQDKNNYPVLENGNYDLNGYELNKNLFDSFDIDYFTLAAQYNNPVLIIQGEKDLAVDPKGSIKLQSSFKNAEILMIKDASHVYQNREHYQLLENTVVSHIVK